MKRFINTLVVSLTMIVLNFSLGLNDQPTLAAYAVDSAPIVQTNEFGNGNLNDELPNARMTYGHFVDYVNMGWVTKVDLYNNGRQAIIEASSPELGNRPQRIRVEIPTGATSQLITQLREKKIDFDAHSKMKTDSNPNILRKIFLFSIPFLLTYILTVILLRRQNDNENDKDDKDIDTNLFGNFLNNGPFRGTGMFNNLRKTKNTFKVSLETGVKFDDIAGIDEIKEDFQEIVDFLKFPDRFTDVGAKVPRGVMLVGPPGTGKTLMAKAIAGEAEVPFLSISGSEFVEMFVGIGASRVRDMFKKAKKNAPCIIFIDEIDAVGRQRGAGVGGGNDEREQTLNQLLTEMDGFEGNTGIIVVAATNRVDVLDAALLRPGRFDRQINVNLPDVKGRIAILKIHARNKKLDQDVNITNIALRTPGFAGADLKNILNEASILAARRKTSVITKNDVNKAIERIISGLEGNCLNDNQSKRLVAYHEVGHAVTATLLPGHDPVEKVTIIPRGQAAGLTWFTPLEDQGLISRGQIIARIMSTLGGRAAEEVIFGETEVTTGANNDFMRATGLARQMVTRFGMSDVGPRAFESQPQPLFLTRLFKPKTGMPARTASKIDYATQNILQICYAQTKDLLKNQREAMDRLVQILMEKETIEGNEFRAILNEYITIPDKDQYASYFSLNETVES